MALGEFDLIKRYFTRPAPEGMVGVGDDAAIVPLSGECVAAADMLVSGRHFFPDDDPAAIGWKSMAVNISDLAAMGAQPRYALLSIALPEVNERWLASFASGLFACADAFGVQLIGGDTTQGPLTIAITVLGNAPSHPLLRRHAVAGDDVWVSGNPGAAALGLSIKMGRLSLPEPDRTICLTALDRPTPRVALGQAMAGVAHAMIDVSDGLLADLEHILDQSNVGAVIEMSGLLTRMPVYSVLDQDRLLSHIAYGGDDYELCWTAPVSAGEAIQRIAAAYHIPVTRIGRITAQKPLRIQCGGRDVTIAGRGFDHFRST